jgi:adenylate kinase
MNSQRIVFLGGVHGVGKSTICKSICALAGFDYLSASELIKWLEISTQHNKLVKDINDTQDRLITALANHAGASSYYILDGHYCLLNNEGVVTNVPLDTFVKISPIGLGIVVDDPLKIKKRLEERDKHHYDIKHLEIMQENELDYAAYVANHLGLSLHTIKHGEFEKITSQLIELRSNESFTRH